MSQVITTTTVLLSCCWKMEHLLKHPPKMDTLHCTSLRRRTKWRLPVRFSHTKPIQMQQARLDSRRCIWQPSQVSRLFKRTKAYLTSRSIKSTTIFIQQQTLKSIKSTTNKHSNQQQTNTQINNKQTLFNKYLFFFTRWRLLESCRRNEASTVDSNVRVVVPWI